MDTPDSERSMKLRHAAYKSWAKTPDRASRTAAGREAATRTRFIDQARRDNPGATDAQIEDMAEALKKAHYTDMALKSAQARRIRSTEAKAAKQKRIAAELAAERAKAEAEAGAA